jgi:hypothetical protein
MKNKLLFAALMATAALPIIAQAQPYDPGCVQANRDNRVAGTIVGGVAGALLGGAIGGRHNGGAGAVVGGVTGAVAGNAIAGANNQPCPEGYVYQGPPPGYEGPPPEDAGFWRGAPAGIHERIDFMQQRIDTSAQRGWLSPREIDGLNADLNDIRAQDRNLHYQDGQWLRPQDRDYLQNRLDNLSQRLHWMNNNN